MNNYLAKPVRAQTLKALLESYLDKENQGKDIPDLASEAKNMVKQALSEASNFEKGSEGGAEAGKGSGKQFEHSQMRSRPSSVRKVTAQRIRPNGEHESGSSS